MGDKTIINILRKKILSGEFVAGKRLAEIPTAESLGVSRTPVRIAFRNLEQEGLLEKLPRRGYLVREITQQDIRDGVEVRGVLEGLAARQAAEKELPEAVKNALLACLIQGDNILANNTLSHGDIERYQKMNQRLHQIIVDASENQAVAHALSLNEHLPFASSNAIAYDPENLHQEYKRFYFAHQQHHFIVNAILQGQSTRAEFLMREHAYATMEHMTTFNSNHHRLTSSNTIDKKKEDQV